jgi:hypothetical protein
VEPIPLSLVKKFMKEILLFATAFSIALIISGNPLFTESAPEIIKENYSLMKCESLYANDYWIETDHGRVKAAVECVFHGYYPLNESTQL